MARRKKDEVQSGEDLPQEATESIEESDADSAALTSEREEAASEELEARQETEPTENAGTIDGEEVSVEDREIDESSMTDEELAHLERQNEVASEGYSPKTYSDYLGESHDSPDINEDAKEFQLDSDRPDEHTGPEAAEEAARTGVNPRSVATSSDPEGMEQPDGPVAPVSENAGRVSKSSTNENPRSINK